MSGLKQRILEHGRAKTPRFVISKPEGFIEDENAKGIYITAFAACLELLMPLVEANNYFRKYPNDFKAGLLYDNALKDLEQKLEKG